MIPLRRLPSKCFPETAPKYFLLNQVLTMNFRLLSRLLGIIAFLIGGTMVLSLPWAHPALGCRNDIPATRFETTGFFALLVSMVICFGVGGILTWFGRGATGRLFRKEAMAVVGLSWILATLLGAQPFLYSGTYRGPSVRLAGLKAAPLVQRTSFMRLRSTWEKTDLLSAGQYQVVATLLDAGARGVSSESLAALQMNPPATKVLQELSARPEWDSVLSIPDELVSPVGQGRSAEVPANYRIRWIKMSVADAIFESQSGFSTTGATVLTDLENPALVPHCILFWRSSTHFLGGLGIVVLFVVILGQGSAGKALMRAEMPGPTKEGSTPRMQHTAWLFAGIYCLLNVILAILLVVTGMTAFDAFCHAFGTLATGGFSTYNTSIGYFQDAVVDYVIILFMVLAGTNFTLLYFLLTGKPGNLIGDIEWRTYMGIITVVSIAVIGFGLFHDDFQQAAEDANATEFSTALRHGLFQVVAIVTTTGFGTHDFDAWNNFGRGVLFLLMFVGGCAGSTGGGMKVIRHILFVKILRLEVERAYRPNLVRPLRIGGQVVDSVDIQKNILVYFGLILLIFVCSWLFLLTFEPNSTWGSQPDHKIIDSASGVAAMLHNIGPGLGTIGATQNYGHLSSVSKLLFVFLMMLGRLEIFAILVLFSISFWRSR